MKRLVFTVFTLFLFFFTSVNAEVISAKGRPVPYAPAPVEYMDLEVCKVSEFDLWAGQDILAGSVNVFLDEDGYLQVQVNSDYTIDEIHLGTYSELPTSRPAPGQMEFDSGPYESGDSIIVLVHVAFAEDLDENNPVGGETAYAGTPEFNGRGAWFYFVALTFVDCDGPVDPPTSFSYQTTYAYFGDSSIAFDLNGQPWGWYATFLPGTYDLYAGAGLNDLSKGTHVGYLTVDVFGNVSFTLFQGYVVNVEDGEPEVHFYIGEDIPERIPGQWKTVDMTNPLYMTFHLVVGGEFPSE